MTALLWDQHTCLPLQVGTAVEPLTRYQRDGGSFVSVNVGYSPHTAITCASFDDTMSLLAHYRTAVEAHPDPQLAATVEDVTKITSAGRIAVVFNLEDVRPLDDDLDNLAGLGAGAHRPGAAEGCESRCRYTGARGVADPG